MVTNNINYIINTFMYLIYNTIYIIFRIFLRIPIKYIDTIQVLVEVKKFLQLEKYSCFRKKPKI